MSLPASNQNEKRMACDRSNTSECLSTEQGPRIAQIASNFLISKPRAVETGRLVRILSKLSQTQAVAPVSWLDGLSRASVE